MLANLGAILTLALGLFGALAPSRVAGFVGIQPLGGAGLSEVRATYGGLFIAMGGACLVLQSPVAFLLAGLAWGGPDAVSLSASRQGQLPERPRRSGHRTGNRHAAAFRRGLKPASPCPASTVMLRIRKVRLSLAGIIVNQLSATSCADVGVMSG
jgi:hypothetical protein